MITYNHASFVEEALSSVVSQTISDRIEIVIGDDGSSDLTVDNIERIKKKHPDLTWNLVLRDKNIGVVKNFVDVLERCQGKYMAILEGDDYWTDPQKLEKQVQLLEDNPEASGCFTHCLEFNELNNSQKIVGEGDPERVDLPYILQNGWFMRTPTLMLRKDWLHNLPTWFYHAYSTDYILHVLFAAKGPFVKLAQTTAAYRRHAGGISIADVKKQIQRFAQKIELLETINDHFNGEWQKYIRLQQEDQYVGLITYAWNYKSWHPAILRHFTISRKLAVLKKIYLKITGGEGA